ncbi:sensor histidine kinase, partial [Streptomyces sp. SID11233]|nr:sensor histidine kinase [Streptomyces sp. SID11233]
RVRRAGDRELPPLDKGVELVLYRVAQEALTNVVRHARATEARLTLRASPREIELTVADDGRGLGDAPEGAGLRGMRERALLIGAHLSLGTAPGGGTEIRLTAPLTTRPSPPSPRLHEGAGVT